MKGTDACRGEAFAPMFIGKTSIFIRKCFTLYGMGKGKLYPAKIKLPTDTIILVRSIIYPPIQARAKHSDTKLLAQKQN